MNTIKSKKLFICTSDMKTYTEDEYGNVICTTDFKEYPYNKPLPKRTVLTQEELELDNGLFIRIKTNIDRAVNRYKIIQILEDTEKKVGYQFDSWFTEKVKLLEEPIFLGGIKNKNAKYIKREGNDLIKIPYDINLEFMDIHNEIIFFMKSEEE